MPLPAFENVQNTATKMVEACWADPTCFDSNSHTVNHNQDESNSLVMAAFCDQSMIKDYQIIEEAKKVQNKFIELSRSALGASTESSKLMSELAQVSMIQHPQIEFEAY